MIKPCPFCGSNESPRLKANSEDYPKAPECYTVVCDFTESGCGAESGFQYNPIKAIQAWNTRSGESLEKKDG